MDEKAKSVLQKLEAQCARREYCSSDILAKAGKSLDGDAAAEVLESLLSGGYVDDLRYASAFAREKSSLQGWGRIKIRYGLAAKGIPRETIDKALEEIDPETASMKLENVLLSKARQLKDDPQSRLKLIKFALSRGYTYDEVKPVLERAEKKAESTE